MLSSPYLTAWRQAGAEEAAEETLILNLSPCHYRPVWPPIRGPWVMWETLGPVLPTPAGQAACSVQTKLKTTGQAQLGLTSLRRRALYAHSVVRRREAWILISLLYSHAFFLSPPLTTPAVFSGLSFPLRLNQTNAEAAPFDCFPVEGSILYRLTLWTGGRGKLMIRSKPGSAWWIVPTSQAEVWLVFYVNLSINDGLGCFASTWISQLHLPWHFVKTTETHHILVDSRHSLLMCIRTVNHQHHYTDWHPCFTMWQ